MARPVSPEPGPAHPLDEQAAQTTHPMLPVGPWTPGERGRAWAVHGFTALGIVASMLALRDVLTGHPDYAILWLLLTLLIDGVDPDLQAFQRQ